MTDYTIVCFPPPLTLSAGLIAQLLDLTFACQFVCLIACFLVSLLACTHTCLLTRLLSRMLACTSAWLLACCLAWSPARLLAFFLGLLVAYLLSRLRAYCSLTYMLARFILFHACSLACSPHYMIGWLVACLFACWLVLSLLALDILQQTWCCGKV